MDEDKINVEELLKKYDGLLKGHFVLTSGKHSDTYFQCAKLYQYPFVVELLAKKLASKLNNIDFDTIVSPAIGAIIFGYEVARQAQKRNLFVERKEGIMTLRRGYELKKDEKVIIIEDVITTAKTIFETKQALLSFGCKIVGVGCIVDRTDDKFKSEFEICSLLKKSPTIYDPDVCPLCKQNIKLIKPGSREKIR